nr:uncharacterized protein LOC119185873 isoform X2 [Rhipicephalus microplus]
MTLDWPDIKCIRAKPVLKNKTAQTLSQTILIKMAIGEVIIWHSMNASYTPLFDEISNSTRRARKFTSVDEGVVSSWELWVNNLFNTSSEFCKKQYLKVCKCDQPMQFNMSDCERQQHNQESF